MSVSPNLVKHYAGSVAFDNDHDQMEDYIITGLNYKDFVQDLCELMDKRRNSSVFFAIKKFQNKEIDITNKVRREVYAMGNRCIGVATKESDTSEESISR